MRGQGVKSRGQGSGVRDQGSGVRGQVYFIGVGPGDPELLTIKGKRIIEGAEIIIYAGSLINPDILRYSKQGAKIYNSAAMSLKEILSIMETGVEAGRDIARLHSGDPAIYGAIQEQIDGLKIKGIDFEIIPGVSSFLASASVLGNELTIPDIVQSVIITRVNKRTSSPSRERLSEFARHGATLVIFLSIQLIEEVEKELLSVCPPDTPAAIIYKATWPDEKIFRGEVKDISKIVKEENIDKTAIIIVGECLRSSGKRSKLYDKNFSHGYRKGIKENR